MGGPGMMGRGMMGPPGFMGGPPGLGVLGMGGPGMGVLGGPRGPMGGLGMGDVGTMGMGGGPVGLGRLSGLGGGGMPGLGGLGPMGGMGPMGDMSFDPRILTMGGGVGGNMDPRTMMAMAGMGGGYDPRMYGMMGYGFEGRNIPSWLFYGSGLDDEYDYDLFEDDDEAEPLALLIRQRRIRDRRMRRLGMCWLECGLKKDEASNKCMSKSFVEANLLPAGRYGRGRGLYDDMYLPF